MRRRVLVVLAVLALVTSACGARFDDDEVDNSTGGQTGGGGNTPTQSSSIPSSGVEGPGPAPGITDTEIRIGYLLPITGAAPIPSNFDKGVNAYWNDVNAKGGINGRKVKAIVEDTQSQAAVGKDKAKKLIEEDKVFTIVVLDRLENQEAIGKYLNDRKFPNIQIQTPANLPQDQVWTFGVTIDHEIQGKLVADYFVKSLGLKKVGVVAENTPTLEAGRSAFKDEVEALGAELVFNETVQGQQQDFSNEALGASDSAAEAIWLYMAPTTAAALANQALTAANYHPIWFANSISWGFDLALAVGGEALKGSRAFSPWLPLSDPKTQPYQAAYKAQNNGEKPDDLGLVGWGVGQIVGEALRTTPDPLGQNSFRETLQNLQFAPDIWAPLDFKPGVREGANVVAVLKEEGGVWVLEQDFTGSF
jgi:branched-chain amino acid transport system substrate-binding protein